MSKLIEQFKLARRVGTPLISIVTPDPAATIHSVMTNTDNSTPIVKWDSISGLKGCNSFGVNVAEDLTSEDGGISTINEIRNLVIAKSLPERTILFILNAHMYLDNSKYDRSRFSQAIWNLRDDFSSSLRSLVLLSPGMSLPSELASDVVSIEEELPDDSHLSKIVTDIVQMAGKTIDDVSVSKAVDAIRGLSAFPAEQATSMCITNEGLDIDMLWGRKRQMINETKGLRVYGGKETFEDIGGCASIKKFMKGVVNGKESPGVIVFMDEGEKMFAGATNEIGDNTGIAQDFVMKTLTYMEDSGSDGVIFVGPPGAAKSAIAKAIGNEAKIPTIMLDLGAIRAGVVGESERNIRTAYKVIDAVGGGRAFFVMTCNKDVSLPPELKRRFTSGTFFFDLPTNEEQKYIWPIYINKYFDGKAIQYNGFDYTNWTGAEIRNCCRLAYRQNISLLEASKYIVPVCKSAASDIDLLRRRANGVYLSANYGGVYRMSKETGEKGNRKFEN